MNLNKLYAKCGEHSSPLSLFRKFDLFHTLCVVGLQEMYGSAQIKGTAVHSRFSVQFL